jgi:hypothetical protein
MRWLSTEACRAPTTTAGASGNGHGRGQLRARTTHGVRTGRVSGRGQNSGENLKCVHGREGTSGGRGLPGARSKHCIGRTTVTLCDYLHQIYKL